MKTVTFAVAVSSLFFASAFKLNSSQPISKDIKTTIVAPAPDGPPPFCPPICSPDGPQGN